MRLSLTAAVVAAGLCMIVVGVSLAAVSEPVGRHTAVALRRGSSNITSAMLAEACAKTKCTLPLALTVESCHGLKSMMIAADGLTRVSGANVYQCVVADQSMVRFVANPPVICAPAPADRVLACPEPTVGSWIQRATVGPACAIAWSPLTTPEGACTAPVLGQASLSWIPPTQNTDGSALTNLAGYRIAYGASPNELTQVLQLAGPRTSYTVTGLAPGTYYFAVRAYTAGTESDASNVVQKIVP